MKGWTLNKELLLERCEICGARDTGREKGICPLSACAKRILNGPCGSMWDGECGVLNRACAHVVLKEKASLDPSFSLPVIPPKDYSKGDE